MAINYSVGNWTVASHEVDTISSTKQLALPDLDYAHDFSVVSESSQDGVRLQNTSGTALESVERLRYSKERVADIYRNFATLKTAQLPSPVGARVLAESAEILTADNSVSGAELEIPIRVWTCIESSTHNAVTGEALLWALKRHIAALFSTGSVDADQLVKLFRGDLDPTK
jgi:hypothetical protein